MVSNALLLSLSQAWLTIARKNTPLTFEQLEEVIWLAQM
jgi:hypothetical protein